MLEDGQSGDGRLVPAADLEPIAKVDDAIEQPHVRHLAPTRTTLHLEDPAEQGAVGVAVGGGKQPGERGHQRRDAGTGDRGAEEHRVDAGAGRRGHE